MTKRLSSKLLAVILTLAICATTVLGCLMTVSADSNSLVTFTDGKTISPTNVTDATIRLTIKLPETFPEGFVATQDGVTYGGIVSGTVALDHSSKLALTDVEVVSGTKIDDTIVSDFGDVSNDIYDYEGNANINLGGTDDEYSFMFEVFDGTNIHYKELTFELSFKLTGADNGDKFKINATSVGVGSYLGAEYDLGTAEGIIVAGCAHALVGNGTPIQTDTVNGYSVYSGSVCSLCHTTFTDPQVVPTKLPGVIKVLEYDYTKTDDDHIFFDPDLNDDGELGTETDPIIIDSALELSYLTRKAGDDTKGMYYKVADGIKGFDMSGGKINLDGTLDDNFDAIQTSGKRHDLPGNNYFQGHFDGNGATVYGLLCTGTPDAAGLFALTKGNVTIKNVNVSLSYLKAKQNAGGIVGIYLLDPNLANPNTDNALNIENCSVTDCHIETTQGGYFGSTATGYIMAATGAIYGGARGFQSGVVDKAPIVVNNCFIKLDEAHFVSPAETQAIENGLHGGIGGVAVSNEAKFYNCVVIGITPYSSYNSGVTASNATAHQHTRLADRFTNIYTDAVSGSDVPMGGAYGDTKNQNYDGRITQLTTSQMKGADAATNMPTLFDEDIDAWEVDVNRGYPNLVQPQTPDLVSDASDYELKLIGTNITYNNDGGYNFNFYYRPNKTDTGNNYEPVLYVAQLNDTAVNTDGATLGSFHRLTGTPLDDAAAAAVDGLQKDDICYTLERLSAREIYNTLLATAVDVQDDKALYGGTAKISIADYAEDVVAGEAFYNDDATDDEKTADKNVAQAVLKYGKASAKALNTKNNAASGTTIYWDGTTASGLDTFETDGDVYIINEASELAYIVTAAPDVTQGKTFKVADGISNIVLQKKEHDNGIMQLSGHDEVRAYFEDSKNTKTNWVATLTRDDGTLTGNPSIAQTVFAGTFDGNGVTIYGMYANPDTGRTDGSVFGTTAVGAVIKNLAVRNCYVRSGWYGAIISGGITRLTSDAGIVTYENIEISGCQIVALSGVSPYPQDMALLYGHQTGGGANVAINNLLVYDNEMYHLKDNQPHTQLVGSASWNNANTSIKNSVVLDCTVSYAVNEDGITISRTPFYMSNQIVENVYSSCADDKVNTKIAIIDREDAMGMAAVTKLQNLDWTDTWCYGTTYPSLAKGAYISSSGKTIYWDNREIATSLDSFEKDGDVYIINKVSELAYISSALPEVTTGKKFRVADGIDKIVLQSKTYGDEIIALDSADTVKDYFAANSSKLYQWVSNTYYTSGRMCFAGSFDGNGAEIYGMLTTGYAAGGLFGVVDGATISNLALKNSYTYLTGDGSSNNMANWQFGLLASYGVDYDGVADENIVNFNGCTIANNYIYKHVNESSYNNGWTGLVFGNGASDPCIMQNMLIYGNSFTAYADHLGIKFYPGLIGDATVAAASEAYKAAHPRWVSTDGYKYTVLENSVVLDTPIRATSLDGTTLVNDQWYVLSVRGSYDDCFENVYTDWDLNKITNNTFFVKEQFLSRGGHTVSENDLIGNAAQSIVDIFNADNAANNNDTVWYTGNGVLLGFDKPTEMLPSAQAAYDAITFKTADNYGENNKTFGVYATSLNLKTNPYISFAFAFSGEYKSNRDKIEVTFKYTVDGKEVTKPVSVATELKDAAGNRIGTKLNSGWSNSSNDRFHIYRFQDIPVEALSSPITVTVAYNGEEKTGTFSVEGFGFELVNAYKKAPSDYYATRIEAVKALLFYTQMLQARYGTTA